MVRHQPKEGTHFSSFGSTRIAGAMSAEWATTRQGAIVGLAKWAATADWTTCAVGQMEQTAVPSKR